MAGLARTLERGIFDGIFIADVIGYYDVYKGSNHAIEQAAQIRSMIPCSLPRRSRLPQHLGISITASTSFEHPYTLPAVFDRDHHTKGRVGWNIDVVSGKRRQNVGVPA